jgi:hypothetical protein
MKIKPKRITTGQSIVLNEITNVCYGRDEGREKRVMALLLCRINKLDKKSFNRQIKGLYESHSINGPLAVGWGMKMMATQSEPGEGRDFFLGEMYKCEEDANLMTRIKKGWSQYNVDDPWWVVHQKPEQQIARYNSEPILYQAIKNII